MIIRVKTRYDKDAVGNNADLASKSRDGDEHASGLHKNQWKKIEV